MKIILLGATGQLGREWQSLVNQGESEGHELLPYSSSQLDITHYREVSNELREQNPDVVVNCAAYTDVDGAEEDRKKAQKVNVEAVLYLAELSNELGFKLIHYSTDYVFPGKKEDRAKFPDGYAENHPVNPINWYGKTKWEGEQAVRHTTDDFLIIRISWLCGQFGKNFVKTMLKLGREREVVKVVEDQWGSPSFAENVVRNSLQLLEADSIGTYHVTSQGLISWYDFAQSIFELSQLDVNLEAVASEDYPTRAARPHFSKLNTQKLEAFEGSHIIDWKSGLKKLLSQL